MKIIKSIGLLRCTCVLLVGMSAMLTGCSRNNGGNGGIKAPVV